MTDLATILIPLAVATAILPIQVAATILMLRSAGGPRKAGAWIGGMTLVRLAQYAILGGVLSRATDDGVPGTSPVEGALLLLVAVFLLVSAARKLVDQPDEDAPPPRWMTLVEGVAPGRAFLMGIGLVALSPKLWAFTIGAIGAIGDAKLSGVAGWLVFVVWVAVAQALHLGSWLAAVLMPTRSEALLAGAADALQRYSRPLTIGVGAVFGIWFLFKSLAAFGFGSAG